MGERVKWVHLAPAVEPGRVQQARRVLEQGLRRGLLHMAGVEERAEGGKEKREAPEDPPPLQEDGD